MLGTSIIGKRKEKEIMYMLTIRKNYPNVLPHNEYLFYRTYENAKKGLLKDSDVRSIDPINPIFYGVKETLFFEKVFSLGKDGTCTMNGYNGANLVISMDIKKVDFSTVEDRFFVMFLYRGHFGDNRSANVESEPIYFSNDYDSIIKTFKDSKYPKKYDYDTVDGSDDKWVQYLNILKCEFKDD